jgi:cytochrome oxidase assembly protein ShyY1
LVALCLVAANWQYHRGVDRHAKNFKVQQNTELPTLQFSEIKNLKEQEWRTVNMRGTFDTSHNVLLRNRYSDDGKYGYEYLTLFRSGNKAFWVDRGWVQAGERATDRPKLPKTPTNEIEITGRIRLNSSLPRGSFFALPATGNLVSSWNLQSKVKTDNFYIDLISGDGVTPNAPAELPELSDGPHMAYALQWIFFAGLIVYGRFLIRKR